MPFVEDISTGNRPSGKVDGTEVDAAIRGVTSLSVRLTGTATSWEEGVALIGWERSDDGGATWHHWISGVPSQGTDQFGRLPSVGRDVNDGALYRPFVVMSKNARCGLEVEVI